MIVRSSEDPKVMSEIHLGQYYFSFQSPQGSCTDSTSIASLEQSQIELLKQAFLTISIGS
jgi:hypothetical protein